MSSPAADSTPSVMIAFDDAKYLFNAGENAIRTQEHSIANRKKLKGLFLTQLSLERAAGVPGESTGRSPRTLTNRAQDFS